MKIERTTNVYKTRVLRKITFYVNVDILMRIMIYFIIFFWIFLTCESYFKRVSIWIFRTRMSIFNYMMFELILIVIIMSNFLRFLMKWINSYLIKVNTNSCRIVHFSQYLCIRSKFLQFSFVFCRRLKCSHHLRILKS